MWVSGFRLQLFSYQPGSVEGKPKEAVKTYYLCSACMFLRIVCALHAVSVNIFVHVTHLVTKGLMSEALPNR